MNMAHGRTGLKAAVMALGLLAAGATAQASPIVSYTTSGQVQSTGVTGTPVISFNSVVTGQSFSSPSSFSLGDFTVAALPTGQSTTYTNTPFSVTFLVNQINGSNPSPNQTPIQVTGVLNGTISGNDQSTVVAKFDPIAKPTFLTGSYSNTLSIFDNPLSLVPSTTNNGLTTAQAYLSNTPVNPVPEPTSVALFLTAIGGLGWKRFRNRKAA
ncbi:MAG: PEP-CTERM sorting domain-containing protein [Isosphaeraceae bacterium]|nr:PEP-CTERM sorting domain-containing protein [Isosphaeraceae bacterium]